MEFGLEQATITAELERLHPDFDPTKPFSIIDYGFVKEELDEGVKLRYRRGNEMHEAVIPKEEAAKRRLCEGWRFFAIISYNTMGGSQEEDFVRLEGPDEKELGIPILMGRVNVLRRKRADKLIKEHTPNLYAFLEQEYPGFYGLCPSLEDLMPDLANPDKDRSHMYGGAKRIFNADLYIPGQPINASSGPTGSYVNAWLGDCAGPYNREARLILPHHNEGKKIDLLYIQRNTQEDSRLIKNPKDIDIPFP